MTNPSAGPGRPVTDEQRIRYMPCVNLTNYDAPPFACMQRSNPVVSYASPGVPNGTLAHAGYNVDGSHVVGVGLPSARGAARQIPTDFVFNGPEVLKAKKPGRCTEDWPARCLHLVEDTLSYKVHGGGTDTFPGTAEIGVTQDYRVGPKANSWLLWNSGTAFMWLGADAALVDAFGDNFEVGIIRPASWQQHIGAQFVAPTQSPEADRAIGQDPSYPWAVSTTFPYTTVLEYNYGGTAATSGIKFLLGGIYEFHFHCTLNSSTAPQASALTLKAFLDNTVLSYGYRVQQIEIDNYGNEVGRTTENVAFSGTLFALENQILNVRNMSAYTVNCSAIYLIVRRTGP